MRAVWLRAILQMMATQLREFELDYSYNQFMVCDASAPLFGLWTEQHSNQCFCRLESAVSFLTIIPEFGEATTRVFLGSYVVNEQDVRVITVPFHCPSGRVLVSGPEWDGEEIKLSPGHYRLYAAQRFLNDEKQVIDLYFEPLSQPATHSEVVKADDELVFGRTFLETADIA